MSMAVVEVTRPQVVVLTGVSVSDVVISASTVIETVEIGLTGPQGPAGNASELVLTKASSDSAAVHVDFSNRLAIGEVITGVNGVSMMPSGLDLGPCVYTDSQVEFSAGGGLALQGYQLDISVSTTAQPSHTGRIYILNT